MKRFLAPALPFLFSCIPLSVHAQPPANFTELVGLIIRIINPLFVLVLGGIFVVFLFGLAKFVFSLGSSDNIEEGKRIMFWGVVSLFVAFSFWGLVALLTNTFLGA